MRSLTRIVPPLVVFLGGTAALLAIGQAWLLSSAIDAAFLGRADLPALVPLLIGTVGVAALRAAAAWGQEVLAQRWSGSVRRAVRDRLLRRLLALGPRFTSGERAGELASTLVGGVDALDPYLAHYLPQARLAVLVPLLVWMAALRADPLSALVLLLTGPLIPLFMWLVGAAGAAPTRPPGGTPWRLAARFLDSVQGLPTLRALGRAADEEESIARACDGHREVTMGVLRLAFVSALALEALATLGTAVVAVQVGLRLLYGSVAFREALFVLVLAPEFYRPLRALGAAFHAGMAGEQAASRIAQVLDAEGPLAAPDVSVAATSSTLAAAPVPSAAPPAIVLDEVRFAYDARGAALDGFSLALAAGTTVALVGPSGAGKTTVAHLLLRFLEPDAGTITVDGVPLAGLAPEAWRRRVAWVPQRPHLFHGTVRDNVALARPDASEDELEDAARRSRLEAALARLPLGWGTPVGEGGERLSGGEAQGIALARAFLKNAPFLLLDEPTAHLDPASESAVVAAIDELRRGRTVLLIAHRLTTAARCDRVAVVSRGRVVEEGPPRELAAAGGGYSRLLAAWRGAR